MWTGWTQLQRGKKVGAETRDSRAFLSTPAIHGILQEETQNRGMMDLVDEYYYLLIPLRVSTRELTHVMAIHTIICHLLLLRGNTRKVVRTSRYSPWTVRERSGWSRSLPLFLSSEPVNVGSRRYSWDWTLSVLIYLWFKLDISKFFLLLSSASRSHLLLYIFVWRWGY